MAKLMVVAALVLAAGRAADDDLDKAAAKAAEMGNYTATVTTRFEGGGGGGGGGGGAGAQPVELHVKADAPMHVKSGDAEGYRKGDVLVVKEGDTWKRAEQRQGGGQGGGGEGGEDRRRQMGAQMRLRGTRAPHETLKDLKSSSFKEVKREDADGGKVYSGDLTEEAVKSFSQRGRRGGGGGGGNDRPAPKATGKAKIWVNGDGAVTKYEIYVESVGRNRNDEEVTTKFTSTVEIKDIGSTKYEVPEEAAKLFESRKSEK